MAKKKELDLKQVSERDDINSIESELTGEITNDSSSDENAHTSSGVTKIESVELTDQHESISLINDHGNVESYLKGLNDVINEAFAKAKSLSIIAFLEPLLNDLSTSCSSSNTQEMINKAELGSVNFESILNDLLQPNLALDVEDKNVLKRLIYLFQINYVFSKVFLYVIYNRPYIDDFFKKEEFDKMIINRRPDLNLVYSELQKLPTQKLDSFIYQIDCPSNIKRELYNSIVTRNVDVFTQTIQSHESEAHHLIALAYVLDMLNAYIGLFDNLNLFDDYDVDNPDNFLDHLMSSFFSRNPFPAIEGFTKIVEKAVVSPDKFIMPIESQMCLFDISVRGLNYLKEKALPSEKKALDRVLSYLDQSPEIVAAYKEYKAKQTNRIEEKKGENEPPVPLDEADTRPRTISNSIKINAAKYDIDKLVKLLTGEDELNNNTVFITLAKTDTSGTDVTDCLKFFLGAPLCYRSYILKWNGKSLVSLKFLIRLLFNTKETATENNVFIDSESVYDGINETHVSKGERIDWSSVALVFNYKKDSIIVAPLGVGNRRQNNIKDMKTIAKIVFACKK